MIGMKPGPDSIGIVAVSRYCSGVAARACGLVSLEPMKVAEILKDRPSWFRDCRCVETLSVLPTGNGGAIELINTQLYAPTTLAPARDFWTLRYSTCLEDGSYVVCERSLTSCKPKCCLAGFLSVLVMVVVPLSTSLTMLILMLQVFQRLPT